MNHIDEVVNALAVLKPYLKEFFENDAVFEVVDTEKCLTYVKNDSIPLNVKEGDEIHKESVDKECQNSKKTVTKVVPKDIYGVALKVIAEPIIDENGHAVGSISVGKSLTKQENIREVAVNLSNSLEQISKAITQLSSNIQQMVGDTQLILKTINEANGKAEHTDEVLGFIKDISYKTNMLGLNAAIESSRAGENGKSFNVVAQEIRKLSGSTNESVIKINDILKNIRQAVSITAEKINDTNSIFEEQAATIEEINASIDEISSMANVLKDMASKF